MKKLLTAIIFLTVLVTCTQEEIATRAYPRVRTLPVTDIASAGVVFRGEITYASSEIIDHGFVWSSNQSLDLSKTEKVRLGLKSGAGVFEANVSFGLVQGVKYYFKAYAQSNTHIVYGETFEFVSLGSLAPVLEDFNPKEATWNDTITLIGKNFAGIVKFGDVEAEIIERDDKIIKVKVPFEYTQPEEFISILFAGNATISKDKFKLKAPVVVDFTPKQGKFGDQLTINGNYFHSFQLAVNLNGKPVEIIKRTTTQIMAKVPTGLSNGNVFLEVVSGVQKTTALELFYYEAPTISELVPAEGTYGDIVIIKGNYFGNGPGENLVKFEDKVAEIISASATEIKVKVPESVAIPKSKVTIHYNQQVSIDKEFSLLPPIIANYTPDRVSTQTEVTISGSRFSPVIENNIVTFNGEKGKVISATSTQIKILVPDKISAHELTLEVQSSGGAVLAVTKVKSPWALVSSFPYYEGNQRLIINHFVVAKDRLFAIATPEYSNTASAHFYEFHPTSNSLVRLKDFPAYGTPWHWSFSVNDKIYIGYFPFREVYEYDLTSDNWRLNTEVTFTTINFKFGLSSSSNGFMFNYDMEYWRYEPANDNWISKSNLPNFSPNNGFAFDNQLFIFGKSPVDNTNQMWNYDILSDTWLDLTGTLPGVLGAVFSLKNKGFFSTLDRKFYKYVPQTNSWTQDVNFPFTLYGAPYLSIHLSSKAYIFNYNDVWEFDPNY